jgi:Family of unknown function (DUF6252)
MPRSIYFLMLLMLILIACEDSAPIERLENIGMRGEVDTMPHYREEGSEIFAYRVDDKVVVNKSEFDSSTNGIGRLFFFNSSTGKWLFYINGISDRTRGYQEVSIEIEGVLDTGIYIIKEISDTNRSQMQYIAGKNSYFNKTYITTNNHIGYVHLRKIDREKKILAGTFKFCAFLYFIGKAEDTVNVSDGWFDVKY